MLKEYKFNDENDKPQGPISKSAIICLIKEGIVGSETRVWDSHSNEWRAAASSDDFGSLFHPPLPPSSRFNFQMKQPNSTEQDSSTTPQIPISKTKTKTKPEVIFACVIVVLLIIATTCLLGGNDVSIVLTEVIPSAYQNGQATTCTLNFEMHNHTKFHVSNIDFSVGSSSDFSFHTGGINASTDVANQSLVAWDMKNTNSTCEQMAQYIVDNINSSTVTSCSMRGLPEEDCQKSTHISTHLNGSQIASMVQNDKINGATQLAGILAEKRAIYERITKPVRPELIAANLDSSNFSSKFESSNKDKYIRLIDHILRLGALNDVLSTYVPGSISAIFPLSGKNDEFIIIVKFNRLSNRKYEINGSSADIKFTKDEPPCFIQNQNQFCIPMRLN